MITKTDLERWPHLARKPLGYWLIAEISRPDKLRLATTAGRGLDETIAHYEETKAGMVRHLDHLAAGGFNVRRLEQGL